MLAVSHPARIFETETLIQTAGRFVIRVNADLYRLIGTPGLERGNHDSKLWPQSPYPAKRSRS